MRYSSRGEGAGEGGIGGSRPQYAAMEAGGGAVAERSCIYVRKVYKSLGLRAWKCGSGVHWSRSAPGKRDKYVKENGELVSHAFTQQRAAAAAAVAAAAVATAAARQGLNEINTAMTLNRFLTCGIVVF
jgi:hypothetical protein